MERYAARQITNSLLDCVEETPHSILVMPGDSGETRSHSQQMG